jgi:hypothetical protein
MSHEHGEECVMCHICGHFFCVVNDDDMSTGPAFRWLYLRNGRFTRDALAKGIEQALDSGFDSDHKDGFATALWEAFHIDVWGLFEAVKHMRSHESA